MRSVAVSEKWIRASLRLASKVLPPDAISAALGTEFDQSYRLGDQVSPKNSPWVLRREHVCVLESGLASDQPLPDHRNSLVGKIRPFAMKLASIRERVDADIFCSPSQTDRAVYSYSRTVGQLCGMEPAIDARSLSARGGGRICGTGNDIRCFAGPVQLLPRSVCITQAGQG
jgi:hypothetical protein